MESNNAEYSANSSSDNSFNIDSRSIDGNWVSLHDGDDIIELYVSNFFWRQAVFVNDKKVSQKTALMKHEFCNNGKLYMIKLRYSGLSRGVCELYGDNRLIDSSRFSLFDENTKFDFFIITLLHGFFSLGISMFCIGLLKLLLD